MKIRRGKHFHQMLHGCPIFFLARRTSPAAFYRNYTGTRRGWIAITRSALIGYMETSYSIGIQGGKKSRRAVIMQYKRSLSRNASPNNVNSVGEKISFQTFPARFTVYVLATFRLFKNSYLLFKERRVACTQPRR